MSTTTTTPKNTTIIVPDGDSEKKGDDQDIKILVGDSEKKSGDQGMKDITDGVSALPLSNVTPVKVKLEKPELCEVGDEGGDPVEVQQISINIPVGDSDKKGDGQDKIPAGVSALSLFTPVKVKLEEPELCEDGDEGEDEDGDEDGDPIEHHELESFLQIDDEENVAVIWEVTFLEIENILSSRATIWAYNHEVNPPTRDNFKQSIRNGLKKIVHPIGFTMANSRSVYIGKKCVVEKTLHTFNNVLEGSFNDNLETYLLSLSFFGIVDVDINVRRASRWLKAVFSDQHNYLTASPGITPETRNQCTPLLFIKCSRMY